MATETTGNWVPDICPHCEEGYLIESKEPGFRGYYKCENCGFAIGPSDEQNFRTKYAYLYTDGALDEEV